MLYELEDLPPNESFGFMERFVEVVIPEGEMKERLSNALSRSCPFRNFKTILDDCAYHKVICHFGISWYGT